MALIADMLKYIEWNVKYSYTALAYFALVHDLSKSTCHTKKFLTTGRDL